MYKIINCEQGSEEWFQARLGKWTASFFGKAITATGKLSASAKEVNDRLVAEMIIGKADETFQSEAMLRGKELESEALDFLNFTHNYNFKTCGFVDSGKGYGCSPDALEESIGLEMKCPSAHTHIGYLAGGILPKKYFPQVQGSMMVTGFSKWVFFSYHPEIKPFLIIVERDEEYIAKLQSFLVEQCAEVKRVYKELSLDIKIAS